MLLILLFVIIFAAGLTLLIVACNRDEHYWNTYQNARDEWYKAAYGIPQDRAEIKKDRALKQHAFWEGIKNFAIGCVVILGLTLLICGMILIINYASAPRDRIYMEETYAALKYAETDLDATIDFTYYEEIISYNAEVRKHQRWNNGIWISWFIPDFWDELPLIEYDLIGPPVPIQ